LGLFVRAPSEAERELEHAERHFSAPPAPPVLAQNGSVPHIQVGRSGHAGRDGNREIPVGDRPPILSPRGEFFPAPVPANTCRGRFLTIPVPVGDSVPDGVPVPAKHATHEQEKKSKEGPLGPLQYSDHKINCRIATAPHKFEPQLAAT
jgi:hypothetical protein